MKQIKAIIERSSEGRYSIYLNDDRIDYGITATGATEAEAKTSFLQAYEEMKAYYLQEKKAFVEITFVFKRDIISFLQYYAKRFTLVGLAAITGIHKSQLSHYLNATNYPTVKTQEKIWQSLRAYFMAEAEALA